MKFIKDIIGEQRDRLGAEPHQQTAREDRQFTPPPHPDPVQDINLKAMSFLRLEPEERVQEDKAPEEVPAVDNANFAAGTEQTVSDLDMVAALDTIGLDDEATDVAEPEEEAPVSSAPSEFDGLVRESVGVQTFTPADQLATSRAPAEQDASATSFDAPPKASPETELGPDPFETLGARLQQSAPGSSPEVAEPIKRVMRRRKPRDITTAEPPQVTQPQPIDVPPPMPGRSADFATTTPTSPAEQPTPAALRSARPGRVKTRLLGFGQQPDPMATTTEAPTAEMTRCPVGWVAIVDGPGRGATFALGTGVSTIGRGTGQSLQLDFGDTSISRENHASLAYDPETRGFYLGHGGKANLVRLNGKPVLSTETLHNGDEIRIGETRLRFVALCGESFDWGDANPAQQEIHENAYQVQGDGFSHALPR